MNSKLTTFNTGGSHEENSIGGIPQGIAPNGNMNKVEEGESKAKGYVYSNEFSITKSHIDDFLLPTYLNGKTYAEATKLIDKRFEDREDNASLSTKEVFLDRLRESQEAKKEEVQARNLGLTVGEYRAVKEQQAINAEQEAMAAQEQQQADPMQQQAPVEEMPQEEGGENLFGGGGPIVGVTKGLDMSMFENLGPNIPTDASALKVPTVSGGLDLGGAAGGLGAASSVLDLVNTSMDAKNTGGNVASAALSGAMSGATAGMALGPIGAGVGAVVGGALQGGMTYLGNKEVAEDLANTKRKDAALNARATNSMHDGGYTHTHNQDTVTRIDNDNPFNFKPTFKPEWDFYNEQIEQERRAKETKELPGFLKDVYGNEKYLLDKNAMDYSAYTTANRKEVPYDTITGIAGLGANLVPLAANIASAANLEEDPGFRYARTGRSYIPDFADERAQLNAADNAYAGYAGKLASASGGNLGAYRANLVGLGANQAESRMAAFNHANDINRTERKLVNEDIVRAAKEDADYTNQERLDNMQNRAAYMAAKQDYLNSAYEGLGSLGKTIFETNQMSGMTTYDILTGKKKKEQ